MVYDMKSYRTLHNGEETNKWFWDGMKDVNRIG